MKIHFEYQKQYGLWNIIGSHTGSSELELGLLRLRAGEIATLASESKETVLVILGGQCTLKVEGVGYWENLGERKDVFSGRATAIYLPCDSRYHITGVQGELEIAIIQSSTKEKGEVYIVNPEAVKVSSRGEGNWRREVHDIIDSTRPANKLLVGETFNELGGWSSYPPHKHDNHCPPQEAQLQEIYHFRLKPEMGFGIQRVYSPEHGLDETLTVQHGDSVFIPFGYHTVGAAAGYRLYYLWALAGKGRELYWNQDPTHAWIAEEKIKNAVPPE